MKERTWLGILLSFAAPCRGKMAASVVLAILSVAGGFVPYLGVYQIIRLFLERQADWDGILFWCGVCLAGYAVKVAGYALSTMLAHVSAYTILEGLRLQAAVHAQAQQRVQDTAHRHRKQHARNAPQAAAHRDGGQHPDGRQPN